MQISRKPHTYQIAWKNGAEVPKVIKSENGKPHFSKPTTEKSTPKLYLIFEGEEPVYIGGTKQPIGNRLRLGFQANGNNGYRGYLWRHFLTEARIDIWLLKVDDEDIVAMKDDPSMIRDNGLKERQKDIVMETVEAEVALLIQQRYGRWPRYQSEIHFHQSGDVQRRAAWEIVNHYRSQSCPTG